MNVRMNADEFHIRRRNDERHSAKRDTNFFVERARFNRLAASSSRRFHLPSACESEVSR